MPIRSSHIAHRRLAGFHSVYEVAREALAPRPEIRFRVTSFEGLATPHPSVGQAIQRYDSIQPGWLPAAQARVCSTLTALFPTAHVLLVTRGFRTMILSSYSQYARSGGTLDLESYLKLAYEERAWDYDYVAGLYQRAFGGERTLVMPYELLRADPAAFTRGMEERLGG